MSRKTPRYGHKPITMRLVKDKNIERAGDFYWTVNEQKQRTLTVAIPLNAKCDRFTWSEWTIDHKNHCNAQWSWNGDEEKPTLKPSLHAVGIWHGWVRNGLLTEG